ncbi:hypothetical protein KOI35_13550 [Actinoplanes bogorensis]|uniref:Uncharacterized protein n=1 Tax=Paractinoplanes bogorensis TaxID=1610840 RepID=A0ABS5YMB6_9ACTN|nr:hypothetical protein [Actinoplanes bogorensis]MBU2664523.1 hypothetical protein [Actinoplanes bogorensis]
MVADIHTAVEVRRDGRWTRVEPQPEIFEHPNYAIFGFLAGMRNYSQSPVIAAPRGLPADLDAVGDDFDSWLPDLSSTSWLTLAELLAYDYDQTFRNRRPPNDGELVRLRDFLTPYFFERLTPLTQLGAPPDIRIVLGFDE